MARTLTHEEFMKKFYEKNKHAKDIEILGTYVNNRTKIKVRCKIDAHEWETTPDILLRGHGCPICGAKIKTHEEFMKELKQKNKHAQDIEVLGTYVNRRTKIKCRCRLDGNEWEAKPSNLLNGHGCPICAINNKTKTHEQFIQELQQINDEIEVLGTYVNSSTKIKVRCKLDGYVWEVKSNDLLNGHGCPKCGGTLKKTHEQFIQELEQVNPDIQILGRYVNTSTKIKCKCKVCGYEWEPTPRALLYRLTGCPKCNISKGEKRVAQYLDNLYIDYIYNMGCFNDLVSVNGGLLRPDFIIPGLKIWIEYDGQQHYEPRDFTGKGEEWAKELFKQTQQNDEIKNQYAKQHNWTLIRIAYWDYDNIEQILDNYIKEQEQAI